MSRIWPYTQILEWARKAFDKHGSLFGPFVSDERTNSSMTTIPGGKSFFLMLKSRLPVLSNSSPSTLSLFHSFVVSSKPEMEILT